MIRAIAIAARLDFTIEPTLLAGDPHAPARDREELAAAAARGVLQDSARGIGRESVPAARRGRLARADFLGAASRREPIRSGARSPPSTNTGAQFESTPDTLSNAILLGSLLVPLGISLHPRARRTRRRPEPRPATDRARSGRAIRRTAPRRSAARAARRRAPASDHRPAAPPAGSHGEPARAAVAHRIAGSFAKR